MRVVLRADASAQLGSGHLMRSLTLGRVLQASGVPVSLVSACASPALLEHPHRAGLPVHLIDKPCDRSEEIEAARAAAAALPGSPGADWIVLDGYHFDRAYQQACGDAGLKVLVIDDVPRPGGYAADIVLNQNVGALRFDCGPPPQPRLLLGCRFALIRPEFTAWRDRQDDAPATVRNVLVTAGGSDPTNMTAMVIDGLSQMAAGRFEVTVLVGGANPRRDALAAACRSLPGFHLAFNVTDMPGLIAAADLVVSAVGGTSWELAFMGRASVVFSLDDPQHRVAHDLDALGACHYLGSSTGIEARDVADGVMALADDHEARRRMGRVGRALVDGCGADRVAAAMTRGSSAWAVRPAEPRDAEPTWQIARDACPHRHPFTTPPSSFGHHQTSFARTLTEESARLWVIERDETIGGHVGYHRTEPALAVADLTVATPFRGQGLGTHLLADTVEAACRALRVPRVRGVAFAQHEGSRKAFLNAGFMQIERATIDGQDAVVFERAAGNGAI